MKSTLVAVLVLTSAPLMLAACQTMIPSSVTRASFCDLAEPVRYSRLDTELTKKQVRELNAIGVKLCGWKGKQ